DQTTRSIEAFEAAFPGISVSFLRPGASNAVINRFSQEADAGVHNVDVINTQIAALYIDNPEWFRDLTVDLVPTLADVPEALVHGNYVQTPQTFLLMAYNSNLLAPEDVPETWQELVENDNLVGKGLMADPRNSDTYVIWLDLMAEKLGDDWI